jgi:hypothetical protein
MLPVGDLLGKRTERLEVKYGSVIEVRVQAARGLII